MNKIFTLIIFTLTLSLTACGSKTGHNGDGNDEGDDGGGSGGNNGVFLTVPTAPSNLKPQIAIVYSKTSEKNFWTPKSYAQLFMSVQSQAMMAGLPYDLLSEDDLLDINKINHYKTLVFPLFAYVKSEQLTKISENLKIAIEQYNVGIITAGDFLTNTETGQSISGDAYIHMKTLLGLARTDGAGPVSIDINISNANHPALANEYKNNETVLRYKNGFTSFFTPTGEFPSQVIATQQINNAQIENEIITITHKGRHAHFATVQALADGNLLWSVLQWSVWGNTPPTTLHIGRGNGLFIARNDMDQSMFLNEVSRVEFPLLDLLKNWKSRYDFVGSYYINVGNRPTEDETTNWSVSAPLYQQYIQLGNEIGTHSYTHPADTSKLTAAQIKFEFADSKAIIEKEMGLRNIGAAVPGNPENLATALQILSHVDYLSGGYAAVGSGFPNAFGYLNAASQKVYLSPNISFDFTLIGFQKRTAEEAKQIWINEFDALAKHAAQPFIHWPWHDYGPNDTDNAGYTLDMYESFIAKANNFGSEFVTGKDFSQRIATFKQSAVDIKTENNVITASVKSSNAGQFALKLNNSRAISAVDRWYAYSKNKVFLAQEGGVYTIHTGDTPRAVTHISQLPSRSQLITLLGNGEDIKFRFSGEGKVEVTTQCNNPSSIHITGGINVYQTVSANKISLQFLDNTSYPETTVDITCP